MELARSVRNVLVGLAAVVIAGWPMAAFGAGASPIPSPVTVPPLTVPRLAVTVPPLPTSITLPPLTLPGVSQQPAAPLPPVSTVSPAATATTTVTTAPRFSPAVSHPSATVPSTDVGLSHLAPASRVSGRLAVQTARAFELPFTVAAAVAAFLIVQARIDRADPKLVDAPVGADEELVSFE